LNSFFKSPVVPPAFYGAWRFITVFTRARHWPLSWARCIQSQLPILFL